MKKLILALTLLCGVAAHAQNSTYGNLSGRATPFSTSDVFAWEIPGVSSYKMTWNDLTNDIIAGLASQGYATAAAQAVTNGYPWTNIVVAQATTAGTATNVFSATNSTIVSISGTNVTVDLSKGNYAWFNLDSTTNAYVRATNSGPANWCNLYIYRGTNLNPTVAFNTNYTMPTIYGQILTQPTNTANSWQLVQIMGDPLSGPTNTFTQILKP